MCLAIPGMVVEISDLEPPFTSALVEFAGLRRRVSLACVPEATVGDYVLVHAGVAIGRVDATEAAKVLSELEQLEQTDEFIVPSEPSPISGSRVLGDENQ
jgi:hydrogenase expression/formation protein HypC